MYPKSGKFSFWTPCAFARNTPIQAIGLDGAEIHDFRLFEEDTYFANTVKPEAKWHKAPRND